MCICDTAYPRKLAFSYLDELSKEFQRSYEGKIESATRPYAFMGFGRRHQSRTRRAVLIVDTFISKTTRLYQDSRTLTQGGGPASSAPPSQLDQLNDNLKDVTRIMTKNMEDLLWRGDSLDRECPPLFPHRGSADSRHVTPLHIAPRRVSQVPQGRTQHQPPSIDTQMGAHWRYRLLHDPVHLVEVLLDGEQVRKRRCDSTTTHACNDLPIYNLSGLLYEMPGAQEHPRERPPRSSPAPTQYHDRYYDEQYSHPDVQHGSPHCRQEHEKCPGRQASSRPWMRCGGRVCPPHAPSRSICRVFRLVQLVCFASAENAPAFTSLVPP